MNRVIVFSTFLILASLWSVPAQAEQGDAATQEASAHHERGIQLFQAGRYQEAAREFERAEELAHSRANLINLTRCYQEVGDTRRARRYLDRYLSEPNLPAESRARAEQIRQELQASGGGGGSTAGPWALLGSGLALLLTGGIFDIVAYVRADTEHDASNTFPSYDAYRDWRSGMRNMAIAGDVLVAVGAAAAIGGLIWLLVARRSSSGRESSTSSISISPMGSSGVLLQTQLLF